MGTREILCRSHPDFHMPAEVEIARGLTAMPTRAAESERGGWGGGVWQVPLRTFLLLHRCRHSASPAADGHAGGDGAAAGKSTEWR